MNWGHLGSAVKCSHSSLTVRTVFAIVFVGILRSVKCWAGVRRKTPGSFLRAAADAQSLGLLNTAAAKPRGPLLRLLEPTDQTLKRRTVKTHLVRERRARWVAVIQFPGEKGSPKMTLLWLFGPMCSVSSFLWLTYISACLEMRPTYWPYPCWRTLNPLGGLLRNNLFHIAACLWRLEKRVLYMFSRNQRAKTKIWRQSRKAAYSNTGGNKQKMWPWALSCISERLMSVPVEPTFK